MIRSGLGPTVVTPGGPLFHMLCTSFNIEARGQSPTVGRKP